MTVSLAAALTLTFATAAPPSATAPAANTPAPDPAPAAAPPAAHHPANTRVGGDMAVTVVRSGESWRVSAPYDRLLIDTPLPDGCPAPTPPGAVEIKHYPSVRRAEVSGSLTPDVGMNAAFFPLFRHISRRNIAMTSPVEMDYHSKAGEAQVDVADRVHSWTMSFLYRTPDLGPTGEDGNVRIVDTPPITVIALGLRGNYGQSRMDAALRELEAYLAENTAWRAVPDAAPRALFYNGPERPPAQRWAEIQIPVEPVPTPPPPKQAAPKPD